MLHEQSIHAAVRETLVQFKASHGRDDLKGFADALLSRLEQRGKPEAVKVLRDFLEEGRLTEETVSALPGPVSTRKSIAPKRRVTLTDGQCAYDCRSHLNSGGQRNGERRLV